MSVPPIPLASVRVCMCVCACVCVCVCVCVQTLIAIRAPQGTTLEVPDPGDTPDASQKKKKSGSGHGRGGDKSARGGDDGADGLRRYQMTLHSRSGSIETFLVSPHTDETDNNDENDTGAANANHRHAPNSRKRKKASAGKYDYYQEVGLKFESDGEMLEMGIGDHMGIDADAHDRNAGSPSILKLAPPETEQDYLFMGNDEKYVFPFPLLMRVLLLRAPCICVIARSCRVRSVCIEVFPDSHIANARRSYNSSPSHCLSLHCAIVCHFPGEHLGSLISSQKTTTARRMTASSLAHMRSACERERSRRAGFYTRHLCVVYVCVCVCVVRYRKTNSPFRSLSLGHLSREIFAPAWSWRWRVCEECVW